MAPEQRFFDGRAVEGEWYFVLPVLVPRCKVGSLIGRMGKVINEIRDEYDCHIEVVDSGLYWFKKDAMVILCGKDKARLIEAFNRVCRIATSPLVPDDGRDVTALCIPARLPYLKYFDSDFTSIAEKFDTSIEIIGVSRVPSLPYDNIIKIIGDRKNVRKIASNLAEDLCKCQRNSELLFMTPNNIRDDPFQLLGLAISPLIVSRNIRVSDEYAIPVETAVDYINTWTEIVSAVTKDTSKVLIIQVIGKRTQVDQAIQFLQKVIGEASLNDENVF